MALAEGLRVRAPSRRASFERAVISFGIDGAHGIAVQNQLLAKEARDPGFSGFGVAGHQDVAAANRERELTTVLQVPEQQTSAAARAASADVPAAASVRT